MIGRVQPGFEARLDAVDDVLHRMERAGNIFYSCYCRIKMVELSVPLSTGCCTIAVSLL